MIFRARVAALLVALVVGATTFVAVPLASPSSAHGGACDAYAQKPKLIGSSTIEAFGSFWCPRGHQRLSITVEVQARFDGGGWSRYIDASKSQSGGTSIGLGYQANYYCSYEFRTVVKGLAGSSGTTTHSRSDTSPVLRANCA